MKADFWKIQKSCGHVFARCTRLRRGGIKVELFRGRTSKRLWSTMQWAKRPRVVKGRLWRKHTLKRKTGK